MFIRGTREIVEVWAPAKLNLFLEVLKKRPDGFHEIETLMTPIDLFDTLYFQSTTSNSLTLTLKQPREVLQKTSAIERLPEGQDNIVVKAAELLRKSYGVPQGASMHLVKRIPVASGLAGGSSDAAAALTAANMAWGLNLSKTVLISLAAELGSDVPFFLGRGPAICRGRGEILSPSEKLGFLHFVVVRPPLGLSTPEVYRACFPATVPQSADELVQALRCGRTRLYRRYLHNQLQPAAEKLTIWVGKLNREFSRWKLLGHQMSGSGTSYFGLCHNAFQARRLARYLRSLSIGEVFALRGSL